MSFFLEENKNKKGKIIPVNTTFSFLATEIFFDESKKNVVENNIFPNYRLPSNIVKFNFFIMNEEKAQLKRQINKTKTL